MRKIAFLLPTLLLTLTWCGSQVITPTKETVTLGKDNFSTYVAVNTNCTYAADGNYVIYFSYFIGADNCKFIDCSVTYQYDGASDQKNSITVPLSLSGDGQANPFYNRLVIGGSVCSLKVTSAKGTVEVYW